MLLKINTVKPINTFVGLIYSFEIFLDVPGKPGKPELVDSDKDHIKIKWTSPISNGGSPIVGYDIERRDRATGRWVKLNKEPVGRQDFTDDRVQEGHAYEYRVSAVNAAGPGKPSDTSNAFIAKPMKGIFVEKLNKQILKLIYLIQKNQNSIWTELLVAKLRYVLESPSILTFQFRELLRLQSNGRRTPFAFQNPTEYL